MTHNTLYEGHSIWITILHMDLPFFSQQNSSALPFTGIRENRKKVCLDYLKTSFSFFHKYSNQTWLFRNQDGVTGFWFFCFCYFTQFYLDNHGKGDFFNGDSVHILSLSFWLVFSDSIFVNCFVMKKKSNFKLFWFNHRTFFFSKSMYNGMSYYHTTQIFHSYQSDTLRSTLSKLLIKIISFWLT